MSVLSNLTEAKLRDAKTEIQGKVLSRPALLVTDGEVLVYACDVDIGISTLTGYDQTPDLVDKNNSTLRNVPISKNNRELIYAEVGNAVQLRRSTSGRYEIVGYAKEMPGTYKRYPIDLVNLTIGAVEDLTISAIPIPLGDLQNFGGGFGFIPLGAIGIYRGSTLIEIRT
jgi:hypothetical protein